MMKFKKSFMSTIRLPVQNIFVSDIFLLDAMMVKEGIQLNLFLIFSRNSANEGHHYKGMAYDDDREGESTVVGCYIYSIKFYTPRQHSYTSIHFFYVRSAMVSNIYAKRM